MTKRVRRETPCSRCGQAVDLVYEQPRGLRAGTLVQRPPNLVGVEHADGRDQPGDPVDDECYRGQYGPTADYGDG